MIKWVIGFVLFFVCVFMLYNTCNGIMKYEITSNSNEKYPVTLIIGSTHGNEPAGFYALHRFLAFAKVNRGKLIIVPSVNTCGRLSNQRNNPLGDYDINRNYPNNTVLNSQIRKLVEKSDWVIDLHEGWGYRRLDNGSIGSGLYAGNSEAAKILSDDVVNKLNKTIDIDYKKFNSMPISNIPGSLRSLCNQKNKHYILVETSGIRDIQPMDVRVNQQLQIIENIVNSIHN